MAVTIRGIDCGHHLIGSGDHPHRFDLPQQDDHQCDELAVADADGNAVNDLMSRMSRFFGRVDFGAAALSQRPA